MRDPASTGGMAVAEGLNYEERIAAWAYTQLLASESVRRFRLLNDYRMTAVWMQAPVAVGDVLVEHSGGGAIYIQAKFRKSPFRFDTRPDGEFVAVFSSFARQYFSTAGGTTDNVNPWSRPFDPKRDLMVLVLPSTAGATSIRSIATVLEKAKDANGWANPEQVFNKTELDKFKKIYAVAKQAIACSSTVQATDDVVRQFLSVVRVLIFDVEDGEAEAAEAQRVLRDSVLPAAASSQAPEVWRKLIGLARAANKAGLRSDVATLNDQLMNEGVQLRTAPAFLEDIQQLQKITNRNLVRLKQLAELRIATDAIQIPRECVSTLIAAIDTNRVVIGNPGTGKSGVMYQLCNKLIAEQKDVVLLLADDLEMESTRPLHEALGIKNDLVEVLTAWAGSEKGYLVVDALDAARDPKLARRLRTAMADVAAGENRWRILASVRRFDLKHSPDTQALFPGKPTPGFDDSEFNGIAHFKVPPLSEAELKIAEGKHPLIAKLMRTARRDKTTREQLTQPFNLSLACELIRSGVSIEAIVPLPTKVALLEKFWNYRVEAGGKVGAKREAVLSALVANLVSNLSMGIRNNPAIFDPEVLYELAEQHVLEPGAYENGVLRFSHHLLHDYAVARLQFRPLSAKDLVQRILKGPEISIYARQSLLLHFDYLWDIDPTRKTFWTAAVELVRSSLPLIARILGTECAVARIREWSDFSPLLNIRRSENSTDASATLIQYIVSEFLDVSENDQLIKCCGAWAKLALELIKDFPVHHWLVHLLLYKLSDVQGMDVVSLKLINETGRRLAENRVSQTQPEERYGPAFITALKAICRTAEACPVESEKTLRPFLTSEFASKFGDRVYWQMTDETKHLLPGFPKLVGDLYVAVFSNETSAEGWEQIGGKIMPMQVQRKDNYRMAEYQLKERFPAFFSVSPKEATRAVIEFFPGFRNANHPRSSGKLDKRQGFMFLGRKCHIIEDFSHIWASDAPHHADDALVVLRHARDGWIKLATEGKSVDEILNLIAEKNELAVIWWNLLEAGVAAPETLGIKLSGLLTERAILTGLDTHHSAAKLLRAVFHNLKKSERVRIEQAIVTLPKLKYEVAQGKMQQEDLWRGLYMGSIKPEDLITTEAKKLMASLTKDKKLRGNPPPFVSQPSFATSSDWSDYVPGVRKEDLKTPTHLAAREWEQKLQKYRHGNSSNVTAASVDEICSVLEGAYNFAIINPPADLNSAVAALIWAQVVGVAEGIVRASILSATPERQTFIKKILLQAATDRNPEFSPETEDQFAQSPSWGSPSPRVDAAQALIIWGRETKTMDDEVRTILRTLANDQHPAVRFQVLGSCNTLYDIDRNLMWELINDSVKREKNLSVWGGLLMSLDRIAPAHQNEVAVLIFEFLKIFPRFEERNRDPGDSAVGILGALFIRFGHQPSTNFIFEMISEPAKNAHYLTVLCGNFRDALTIGFGPSATESHKQIHARALKFFLRIVESAKGALDLLMGELRSVPEPERKAYIESIRSVLLLLDAVNLQVFFASGAHDAQNARSSNTPAAPPPKDFWKDTAPIIHALVSVESAHIAYHLAETLEYLIPADPEEIFRQLVILVRNANKDGFAQESLAVGVITKIVERYLVDYSDIFTGNEDCRKGLIEVLDAFAAVGWQEARRLIRNLSRIYR